MPGRRKINKILFARKANLDFLSDKQTETELAVAGAPNLKLKRAMYGGAIAVVLAAILLCSILIPLNAPFFCTEEDYDFIQAEKSDIPEEIRFIKDESISEKYYRYYLKKNEKRTLFYYQDYVWYDDTDFDCVRINAVKKNVRAQVFEELDLVFKSETTKNGVKIYYSERKSDGLDSNYYDCRFKIGGYVYYVSMDLFNASRFDYYMDLLTR